MSTAIKNGSPFDLFYAKTSVIDSECEASSIQYFKAVEPKPFDKTEFSIPAETEIDIQALAGSWYTTKVL